MIIRVCKQQDSTIDVYSRKLIIVVTSLKIMKWYDYGYLDETEVRREDQQLYKFKEVMARSLCSTPSSDITLGTKAMEYPAKEEMELDYHKLNGLV
ncbi:hypothetical protein Tco_0349094 [Tanacetum coccineum]